MSDFETTCTECEECLALSLQTPCPYVEAMQTAVDAVVEDMEERLFLGSSTKKPVGLLDENGNWRTDNA